MRIPSPFLKCVHNSILLYRKIKFQWKPPKRRTFYNLTSWLSRQSLMRKDVMRKHNKSTNMNGNGCMKMLATRLQPNFTNLLLRIPNLMTVDKGILILELHNLSVSDLCAHKMNKRRKNNRQITTAHKHTVHKHDIDQWIIYSRIRLFYGVIVYLQWIVWMNEWK